jgi:phage baseplate assembly protein W
MMGMDQKTGKLLVGLPFVEQCIRRIIRTQKGSIPMMRWFGLDLMQYVDKSITSEWLLNLTADIRDSIQRAIPSLRFVSVEPSVEDARIRLKVRVIWQESLVEVDG